jgi:hypothetical protein
MSELAIETKYGCDFAPDFLRGQSDCKQGLPHDPSQSEAYTRGYSAQYSLEQVLTARSI